MGINVEEQSQVGYLLRIESPNKHLKGATVQILPGTRQLISALDITVGVGKCVQHLTDFKLSGVHRK